MERDRSPIDQDWIRNYCDEFMKIAIKLDNGPFKDAILRRVECVQDLVDAWQQRNVPINQRFNR